MSKSLIMSLGKLANAQSIAIDMHTISEIVNRVDVDGLSPSALLDKICNELKVKSYAWVSEAQDKNLPLLAHGSLGWGMLRGMDSSGKYVFSFFDEKDNSWFELSGELDQFGLAMIEFSPYVLDVWDSKTLKALLPTLLSHKKVIYEIIFGSIAINLIAVAVSFYSMQVYDRVIPSASFQTLLVLSIGAFVAILFELFAKLARSKINQKIVEDVDERLSRVVIEKFLAIRLDAMPKSVGSMASQLKSYESVRGFLLTLASYVLVDLPFVIIFIIIFSTIAGWLTLIPLALFVIAIVVGMISKKKQEEYGLLSSRASNQKTGLLVESIEGAETIKSGNSGWRFLSDWVKISAYSRENDLKLRNLSEVTQYLIGGMQQLSYICVVAIGAIYVVKGEVTAGGLIACSILSGRIMGPISSIPGLWIQWGSAKAALEGLEKLFSLPSDSSESEIPVSLDIKLGNYGLEKVKFSYSNALNLNIPQLAIRRGEKIGILGSIGSGKTTLLRLLSGMYKPSEGRIWLDSVDIATFSKDCLAGNIGYLQQEGRLFSGSLKDNLLLGLINPGDEKLLQICQKTGLLNAVIKRSPKGLDQEIFEGGAGFSGGQKQLINLTRLFIRNPNIWLLDEPTASMDHTLATNIINLFKETLTNDSTFVLVTHKPEMLLLVDRLIVFANGQIVIDGPKDEVIKKLQQAAKSNGEVNL
jgi:ATP-binding cassette subfamily C protein LapB